MADQNDNSEMFGLNKLQGETEEPMVVTEEKGNSTHGHFHAKRFPEKLWDAACSETSDLISWAPDGASLYVHEERFEEEVQTIFPGLVCVRSFTNFRRQLREYGFDWRQNHVEMLFHFSHPLFRRDAPRSAKNIETRRRSRTKQTIASSNGKGLSKGKIMTDSAGNEMGEGSGGAQITVPLRSLNLNAQSALMPCGQQSHSGLTYHVMPVVQPTQAYFIPFSQGHQQEVGGSGDYKKSEHDDETNSPPGAPPSSSSQGPQPSAPPMPMMTMMPTGGGLSYGLYFPQCSPWMQHFGANLCNYPVQNMPGQSDGSTSSTRMNIPMQNGSGSSAQWPSASPDQPRKKRMKLDFDWYGRITPIESTSPDRNSTSSMSTSKGTPPNLDQ